MPFWTAGLAAYQFLLRPHYETCGATEGGGEGLLPG